MSSDTVDVGIDLGTSNSSVAVAVDGDVEIARNNENTEVTPSVVRFLPNGSVQVGRTAYQFHVVDDSGNSFSKFKRRMGTQDGAFIPAIRRAMTPEELAAELLKSLRLDAEGYVRHQVTSAVITVPAAFELVQLEATKRAAALAGISYATLLQEPIAAGLAYGYDRDLAEGFYLVFDLGGGTFDASLVRVYDSQLSVVDSDGDNFLGGADMDRILAGFISRHLAEAGFTIWDDDDPRGKEFRARLRLIAEDAKIRLSRLLHVDVYLDGSLVDAEGTSVELTVPIARTDYEFLIEDEVEKSTDMVKRLLERAKVPADAVTKTLFVGGPTYTPLIGRMVPALTGIAVEARIDPMTVVARGAARFASALPVPRDTTMHVVTAGLIRLSLSYPSSSSDEIAHVGGRVEDVSASNYSVEIRRSDGGWGSGRIPVLGNAFMTTVELLTKRASSFNITCFDGQGRPVPVTPESFSISHGLMAAEPPLARSIFVVAREADDTIIGRQLLRRGVSLPATGRETFKAAATVNPGEAVDALNIHVYEGDFESIELNRHVGFLQITGAKLERALPENTPIEVTIRVDASRTVKVKVYIPLLDKTIEADLSQQILLPEDPEEIRELLQRDRARAEHLQVVAPNEVQKIHQSANEIEDDLMQADGGDEDLALRADRRRKELANQIDQLTAKYEMQLLANEIELFLEYASRVADDCADSNQGQRLITLRGEADQTLAGGEKTKMVALREDIRNLYWDIVWECVSWWVGRFLYLADKIKQANLARVVEPLLVRGQAAIQAENLPELRLVCQRLEHALPQDWSDGQVGPHDVGLRV